MHYEHLATELIIHIFTSTTSVPDTLALSATCRRYRSIFKSQRLAILAAAAEAQYGPLHDSMQLLTHNDSQPAHIIRSAPLSFSLLKQAVLVGHVAEKWVEIYPFKRWKLDFENRRVLTDKERYRIRRAIYRLWLYSKAFHNRAHGRETRLLKLVVHERALLLHNWSTAELVELADVRRVMRDVIAENVCPSNGTIARKWRKRFPEATGPGPLMFNIHLNYPPPPPTATNPAFQPSEYHSPPHAQHFQNGGYNDDGLFFQHRQPQPRSTYAWSKYNATPAHNPGAEGWGDDIAHYYVVEDMLKLSPAQVLWLKENARLKREVEAGVAFFAAGGDVAMAGKTSITADAMGWAYESGWFNNNGETFVETMKLVLSERGEVVDEVLGEDGMGFGGDWGVVRDDEDDL